MKTSGMFMACDFRYSSVSGRSSFGTKLLRFRLIRKVYTWLIQSGVQGTLKKVDHV